MNKTELIAEVALKAGLSKKDAEKALNATVDAITEALVNGEINAENVAEKQEQWNAGLNDSGL